MARNERRNSGSRRSRNERPDRQRDTDKKRGNASGNRENSWSPRPSRTQAFKRRQDGPGEGATPRGEGGRPGRKTSPGTQPFGGGVAKPAESSADFGRSEKRRPFQRRDRSTEKPRSGFGRDEAGGGDKKNFPSKRGFRRSGNEEEGRTRQPRTFNRSDFTKVENPAPQAGKKPDRAERGQSKPFHPRKGKPQGGSFDEKRPYKKEKPERKSFVESRLDKQRTPKPAPETGPAKEEGLIRLNKFIANSGVCSRREADHRISMGLVSVNGTTITEMGYKVKPTDEVRYEGKRLKAEKPVYILLNKPKGFITTTEDPQERHTVMNLIANACSERVYPVGRLDRNTTGLLLLTNDGDLADKLTHPSYNVKKIYKVELDKPITKADFEQLAAGIRLEEGVAVPDDLAIVSDDRQTVGIELHIGWNRIVRRLFESLGYAVVKLDRVVYAGLDKKDLPRGNWRFLTQQEIVRLKHYK